MKALLFVIISVLVSTSLFAQRNDVNGHFVGSFNYNISTPTGALKDFVGSDSFYGWSFDFGYAFGSKYEIGGRFGLYDFYQEFARRTYSVTNGDVTANKYHKLKEYELMFMGRYLPFAFGYTKPIFGMSAGISSITKDIMYGRYTLREKKNAFSVAPEIGLRTQLGPRNLWLNTLVRYHYSIFDLGDGNLNSLKFNVGLSFLM